MHHWSRHTADVCVVGAGLSGLATAIKLKLRTPDARVLIAEKKSPQSNTQIAGMRFRAGISNLRQDSEAEILDLLARRNGGRVTEAMTAFARLARRELEFWEDQPGFVGSTDRPEWFGPQWGVPNRAGGGRAKSVLVWLRSRARDLGIPFVTATLERLVVRDRRVAAALLLPPSGQPSPASIHAADYVIAAGSATGSLFASTNKRIERSGPEVAFGSGFALTGSTLHMIHPFGNSDPAGRPRVGCLETDLLDASTVYVTCDDGTLRLDDHATGLLRRHQAHYQFPALADRFFRTAGPVHLIGPDGRRTTVRPAQHYHHLGIHTVDGVRVGEVDNLFAVGDAAGISFWTDHHERFPGFALTKCLTDAAIMSEQLPSASQPDTETFDPREVAGQDAMVGRQADPASSDRLRQINTSHLIPYLGASDADAKFDIGSRWTRALTDLLAAGGPTDLGLMSLAMAAIHRDVACGGVQEPLLVSKHAVLERFGDQISATGPRLVTMRG